MLCHSAYHGQLATGEAQSLLSLRRAYSHSSHFIPLVQSLSSVRVFVTPWTAAHQASLSFTISRSLLKLMSIKSVMPSNHLILCCPLLLAPSIFPSIRVFSNESVLPIRWLKYWSFSFSISPSRTEFLRTDPYQSLDSPKYITSHNVPS